MKHTQILLVGTYCGLNKGDRLMQSTTAAQIQEINSNVNILLASPFPQIDKNLYDFSVTKSNRRNLPITLLKILTLLIIPPKARLYLARKDKELKSFLFSDKVIDLSGDMLTEDYGFLIGLSHSTPLIISILLKKELYILAQSIGPFKILRPLYIWIFKNSKVITARDPITYKYLQGLGLKNIELTADIGFLLKSTTTPRIDNKSKRLVGLAPSSLLTKKFNHHKKKSISTELELAKLIDKISRKLKIKFVLIPHVDTPRGKNDYQTCLSIQKLCNVETIVIDKDLSPDQLKGYISQLSAMIAFRMHAAINALDSGVPTITVSYSHKTVGLYKLLNLDKWVIPFNENTISKTEELLSELLSAPENFKSTILKKLPEIRKSAARNIELLNIGNY